ncbi:hypothetical protein T492DRAFT_883206 [Pavlovales sp. CCMP2436]|nr:hypothetical protein T492DRAFT_883206 [Pavlovales sp. CCMP2436]
MKALTPLPCPLSFTGYCIQLTGGDASAALALVYAFPDAENPFITPSSANWLSLLSLASPLAAQTACARRVNELLDSAATSLGARLSAGGRRMGSDLLLGVMAILRGRAKAAASALGGALELSPLAVTNPSLKL